MSITAGETAPPLLEGTIGEALDRVVAEHGDAAALIVPHQAVRWTWRELVHRADQLASALLNLGLVPGDRIGMWAPNCAEWTVTQFAAARMGLILVNINPAYRLSEVEFALNKVGCRALICAQQVKTSNYIDMVRELGSARLPQIEFLISLGANLCEGFIGFDTLLGEVDTKQLAEIARGLDRHDPINIQFTSGTTGAPKGATLTHRNILNNGLFVGRQIQLTARDRVCIPVPLYHCFGMVMGNLACLTHGAAMVYPSASFDPLAVLKTVADERCTALYGVPTMFIAELNDPEFTRFDLSSLRTGIMAGSPCPEATMREVMERMHMGEVTIAYGMTETSPVSFQTSPDDAPDHRVCTVGRVQPHLEIRLVDEHGAVVPIGTPGEICTKGYSVMQGYWDDPVRTVEAIDSDGFMRTGDLGTLDSDGYCRITGRIKDMLIRGGENIYPREIEEFLMNHPAIADVQVVGVPDEKYGEEVCACIVVKQGSALLAEEVRTFCRGQIAHYKIPRHVLFMDGYPMTVTGKIQKFILRAQAAEVLGSGRLEQLLGGVR